MLFHGERCNRRSGEFVGKAHATFHAEAADHMQHQVLGVHTALQLAINPDASHLELVHGQALAREHITHLAGADAKGDRAEGPVGGGVGIAAGHGEARLGQAQFRGHHMHDPLAATAEAVEGDAVIAAVALQSGEHLLRQGIGKGSGLAGGGNDVIHRGHRALGMAHLEAQILQCREGLRAGHLMDQVQTDEQLGGPPR